MLVGTTKMNRNTPFVKVLPDSHTNKMIREMKESFDKNVKKSMKMLWQK